MPTFIGLKTTLTPRTFHEQTRKVRARLRRRKHIAQGRQIIDAIDSSLFMNLMVAEFIQALGKATRLQGSCNSVSLVADTYRRLQEICSPSSGSLKE